MSKPLKIILFVILYFQLLPSVAQGNMDSLRQLLGSPLSEYDRGIILTHLGAELFRHDAIDSSINCYRSALEINKAVGNVSFSAANLNDLGALMYKKGEFGESLLLYSEALESYYKLKDTLKAAYVEMNLGILNKDRGFYERALDYTIQAAGKLETQAPDVVLGTLYNTIALIYSKVDEFEKAKLYHQKALEARTRISYMKGMAMSLNNIGNTYSKLEMYDSALFYYKEALVLKDNGGSNGATGSTLSNIGEALVNLNKYDEAEPYYYNALAVKRATEDHLGELITLNSLGRLKMRKNDFLQASQYLDSANRLALRLGVLEEYKVNVGLTWEMYEATDNYKHAIKAARLYQILNDSLMNRERLKNIAEMQVRYETERKEREIALLQRDKQIKEAEIEISEGRIFTRNVTIILVTIIGLLFFTNARISKKSKVRVEMLMKELQHRIKNHMQVISSMLNLQSQQLTDIHAIEAIKSGENRINAMAIIHKELYATTHRDNINLQVYIAEIIHYLMAVYGYDSERLVPEADIAEIHLDIDTGLPLGLIVNELVSNSLKHAYHGVSKPELMVKLKLKDDEKLELVIKDNGRGIPEGFDPGKSESLGLKIVRSLVKDLKGELSVLGKAGVEWRVVVGIGR